MSIQLNDIEIRLQTLIEVILVKYLPKPWAQDRIAQRMAEALRANLTTSSLRQPDNSVPKEYLLVVHPSTLEQWQQDPRLMAGLAKVILLVTSEIGFKFTAAPTITLTTDSSMAVDSLDVRINKPESVAETQNMSTNDENTQIPSAFLIVGGTDVFTLDKAVTNIGRRFDNHLVLDDPRVSRYHAQIRYVRNHFSIFDLNSTGGTFVNGQRMTQSALYPGDVISLAGLPIVFGYDSPPPSASKGDTAPLSPAAASSERTTIFLKNVFPKNDKPT
jgi:pSer/pThr/pTyr-binding forkhead associated (FHA) protein